MSPQVHDRIFGLVSHLPHITAAALVNTSGLKDLQFAGRGFIDTTRVASGPANIWTDILLTNSQNCAKGIQKLISQLEELLDAVSRRDNEKIEKLLDSASRKREKLIQYKIDQQELF
jgi:prephenate dehydrogenase